MLLLTKRATKYVDHKNNSDVKKTIRISKSLLNNVESKAKTISNAANNAEIEMLSQLNFNSQQRGNSYTPSFTMKTYKQDPKTLFIDLLKESCAIHNSKHPMIAFSSKNTLPYPTDHAKVY